MKDPQLVDQRATIFLSNMVLKRNVEDVHCDKMIDRAVYTVTECT